MAVAVRENVREKALSRLVGKKVKEIRFAFNDEDVVMEFEDGSTAYFLRDHPFKGERGMVVRLERPGSFIEYI